MKKLLALLLVISVFAIGFGMTTNDSHAKHDESKAKVEKEAPLKAEVKKETSPKVAECSKEGITVIEKKHSAEQTVKNDKSSYESKNTDPINEPDDSKGIISGKKPVYAEHDESADNIHEEPTDVMPEENEDLKKEQCTDTHKMVCYKVDSPTCFEGGTKYLKCEVCGLENIVLLDSIDHEFVIIDTYVEITDTYYVTRTEHACIHCGEYAVASSIRLNEDILLEDDTDEIIDITEVL